jgi:hypothetical protein
MRIWSLGYLVVWSSAHLKDEWTIGQSNDQITR